MLYITPTVLYCTILYYTVLSYAMPLYTMLWCALVCDTML